MLRRASILRTGVFGCIAFALSSCGGDSEPIADSATVTNQAGSNTLIACLDAAGVPHTGTIGADGGFVVPNQDDPAIKKKLAGCVKQTQPEASSQDVAYANQITQAVVQCMNDKGYHATTKSDGIEGANGASVISWSVPAAEQTGTYDADTNECFASAQSAVPSPPK